MSYINIFFLKKKLDSYILLSVYYSVNKRRKYMDMLINQVANVGITFLIVAVTLIVIFGKNN